MQRRQPESKWVQLKAPTDLTVGAGFTSLYPRGFVLERTGSTQTPGTSTNMYLKAACALGSLQPEAGTVILQATGLLWALTSFLVAGIRAQLALGALRGMQPAR